MTDPNTEPAVVVTSAAEPETIVTAQPEIYIPANRPRRVYGGMWGPLEIGAVSVAGLVVLLAGVLYFFWVVPSDRELARNRSEAERLDAEFLSAKSKYGEITDTQTEVEKIVASVDDFEARFLPLPSTGQTALYQRLNGLLAAYGLTNTTGPDYAPLETAELAPGQQSEEEKGRSKYRSLYPGVYVSTTVEGSYHNLRRFIREIETGREFIIVSAVELAPSDTESRKPQPEKQDPNAPFDPTRGQNFGQGSFQGGFGRPPVQAQPQVRSRPKGKTHGETVSLHIEMAAYFRRPNFTPAAQ
jgi:Tfp pilus assembly protein PilO